MTNDQQEYRKASPAELTAHELRVALALMGCPESRLYRGGVRPSLSELGALMGISRERVRQIEERALRRIRKRMLHEPATARLVRRLFAMTNDE